MQSALRAYLEKHPNSINDDPCYAANGTRLGHALGTHTEMGLQGNSVLPNETQLDYAARIGLESDQFASNTSGFNGFINCQEKMPLS